MKRETIVTILGYATGGIGGYAYYLAFPCQGGCTVTSNALITVMLGAFIGGFVFQFVNEMVTSKSSKNV